MAQPVSNQLKPSGTYANKPLDERCTVNRYYANDDDAEYNIRSIESMSGAYIGLHVYVTDVEKDGTDKRGEYVITKLTSDNDVDMSGVKTLQEYVGEQDPQVYEWAKQPTKPSYNASEVGAVPDTRTVNGKALSSDINLIPSDIGAQAAQNGKGLSTNDYSDEEKAKVSTAYTKANSAIQPKTTAAENNFTAFDANGNIKDSGHKHSDYAPASGITKSALASGVQNSLDAADNAIPMPDANTPDDYVLSTDSNEPGGLKWIAKPTDGVDGDSTYQVWLDYNNYDASQHPVSEFIEYLKAHISKFMYEAYDSDAAGDISDIGDIVTSNSGAIGNTTPSAGTKDVIVLMPNNDAVSGTAAADATMMFATIETSTQGEYEFVYVGFINDLDASTFVAKSQIVNNLTTGGANKVLSAEAGKELNYKIGGDYGFTLTINSTQEHSATLDRENIYIPSGSMFRISIEAGTSSYTGSLAPSVHYVGDPTNTQLNGVTVSKSSIYKANKAIDSIGFYIANPAVGTLIITIHCYSSLADGLAHLDYLNEKGISFNPEYIVHSGVTNSQKDLIPASVFTLGEKYRLIITSETGVDWDSETYPGTGNLMEIVGGGISPSYSVTKSQGSVSFPIVLDFTSNGTKVTLYSLRCLENQGIDCALYKLADFEKNITNRLSTIENVVDKDAVTFIPIIDKDYERTSGTSIVVVYHKNNIEVGARYRLELSTASITFDSTTYAEGITNLLSIYGCGLSEKKITKTETIDFPLNLSYEFVGNNASSLQYSLRCLESEKIHIRLFKLARLESEVKNIKGQLEDANLNNIVDEIDTLKEKIALLPIVDKDFSQSNDVQAILNKANIVNGAKYRIIVNSDTGITFDDETYSQYNPETARLIALYSGGIGDIGWKESELNLPIDITFTGDNSKSNLSLYTLRCHTNESVNIKLYKLGSIDEQLDKLEHFDDNTDLSVVHKDALEAVNAAKSYANTYGQPSIGENYHIAILQMSDTHTDWNEVDRCIELANSEHSYNLSDLSTKSKYFDILIHTGDIVEGPADLTTTNWKNRVTASDVPVLALAGNHEMAYILNSSYNFGPDDADIHDRLYNADIVSHNGEIHPTIDGVEKNYYYKDITKNGKTIRLICLYQFEWDVPLGDNDKPLYPDGTPAEDGVHMGGGKNIALYTQDQIDWFVDTLKDAATNNYPVIVATHMPISAYSYVDCAFSWDGASEPYQSMFARLTNKTFFYSIIDAFVNGDECNVSSDQPTPDGGDNTISVNTSFSSAGKFICNICGHHHRGGIMKMIDEDDNISDYYIIMNPTSSSKTVQNYGNYSRTDERTKDCFNCIVWDSYLEKFKVIRIGANLSTRMESAKYYIEPDSESNTNEGE